MDGTPDLGSSTSLTNVTQCELVTRWDLMIQICKSGSVSNWVLLTKRLPPICWAWAASSAWLTACCYMLLLVDGKGCATCDAICLIEQPRTGAHIWCWACLCLVGCEQLLLYLTLIDRFARLANISFALQLISDLDSCRLVSGRCSSSDSTHGKGLQLLYMVVN